MTFDLTTLNRAQLTILYNSVATKPVKSFSTHGIAVERVQRLVHQQGLVVCDYTAGVQLYPADEVPVSMGGTMEEETVDEQEDAEEEAPVAETAPAAPVSAPAAVTVAAAPAAKGKRGPAPSVSDDDVFLSVAANPKRAAGASHARYALYSVGKRVGDYLQEAVALQGKSEGRWRADVIWDVSHGFVTVGPAQKSEG